MYQYQLLKTETSENAPELHTVAHANHTIAGESRAWGSLYIQGQSPERCENLFHFVLKRTNPISLKRHTSTIQWQEDLLQPPGTDLCNGQCRHCTPM